MPVYIVCHKKRNNPRMDVRICETKCPFRDECREFVAHREVPMGKEGDGTEGVSVKLQAA